jgi:quinol monooxygenase YgiN
MDRSSFLATLAAAGSATQSASRARDAVTHVAIFRVPDRDRILAMNALEQIRDATRAHAGNLSYDVFHDITDANAYFIVERWESMDALQAHESTTAFKKYGGELNRLATLHATATGAPF